MAAWQPNKATSPLQRHHQSPTLPLAKSPLSLGPRTAVPNGQRQSRVPEQSSIHGSFVADVDARILGLEDGGDVQACMASQVGCGSEMLIRIRGTTSTGDSGIIKSDSHHSAPRSSPVPVQYPTAKLLLHEYIPTIPTCSGAALETRPSTFIGERTSSPPVQRYQCSPKPAI